MHILGLRWVCVRLWSRRGTVLFALLWFFSWLFLNGIVLVHRRILSDFCTDHKSKDILHRLCTDFREGVVTGDMCSDLCELRLVEYQRCHYYDNGKKVIEAKWRGRRVILKSKLENFSSYEPLGILEYQDSAEELSALDVVYYATLEVRHSLGLSEDEEEEDDEAEVGGAYSDANANTKANQANSAKANSTLSRLLFNTERGGNNRSYSRAELASLWSLLQQEEYTFLRLLGDLSSHVSQVLGSCGHFYCVEFLSAGRGWDQNIFNLEDAILSSSSSSSSSSINTDARNREMVHRIALSFLQLAWHFENDFTHTLHLCDIKPENFAIRSDLTVVAIDVDMAFFEPKMRAILEQNCSSDEDCCFFDCLSVCNTHTHRCTARRKNTNLQVICEKIFRPWFSPTLLGAKAGLPLQIELQRAVQECSETDSDAYDQNNDSIHTHSNEPNGDLNGEGEKEEKEEEEEEEGEEVNGGKRRRGRSRSAAVHQRLVKILTMLLEETERGGATQGKRHDHTDLNF